MKKLLLTITTICCTLTACAPSLSRTIDAPELPTANLKSTQTARPGSSISILSVEDTRQAPSSDAAEDFTEPFGGVPALVENTIREGFQNSGITLSSSAPASLKVQITKWKSKISSAGTGSLSSDASLYVEVFDPTGKKIFSATYNGVRSSQFPVINRIDVKDSLALAMTNAIEQMISDPQITHLAESF